MVAKRSVSGRNHRVDSSTVTSRSGLTRLRRCASIRSFSAVMRVWQALRWGSKLYQMPDAPQSWCSLWHCWTISLAWLPGSLKRIVVGKARVVARLFTTVAVSV